MSEGVSLNQLSSRVASLIGPFAITFETPGIGQEEDGAVLTELPPAAVIIQHMIVTHIAWDGGIGLSLYLGGSDFEAPADDFSPLGLSYATGNLNFNGGAGYALGLSQSCFGMLSTNGVLIAQCSGVFTAGSSDVYAIILSPAA